jgi:hypothetical protein
MELEILLTNPLGSISFFQLLIDAGMLIVVLVTFVIGTNKANQEKFDKKADVERVVKIEEEMDCVREKKSDVDYVRELNRALHHRIDENEKHTISILNQIQQNQEVMQSDIKDILKMMPR